MQSSIPCSNTRLNFEPYTTHISSHRLTRTQLQLRYQSISSSKSSDQLILRSQSQFQSRLHVKPIWNSPITHPRNLENTDFRLTNFGPLHCGISSNTADANNIRSFREWIELIGELISTAFPIWVSLGCLLGLVKPSSFNWVQPKWTIIGLTLTMLGMGMTLTLEDLRGALAMPKEIISGFVLQYSVCVFLHCINYIQNLFNCKMLRSFI